CTAVIASGRAKRASLAKAYLSRCEAQGGKYTRLAAGSGATSSGEDILASAIRDCGRAIRLAPNNGDAYFKRALYYTFQKDTTRAIADYNRLVKLRPKSGGPLAFRGRAYLESGAYDRALLDCTEALKRGYTIGGLAQDCLDQAGTAKQRLAGGQKLGDPRAWCDGKALAEEGFPQDRQIEGCTLLINSGKETPDDLIKDHFNRARAYDFEGAADKAIDDYNVVIDLQPRNADAHGSLGVIYWVKNDYDRAIGNFDKAIALNGSRMDLYFPYRGRCHFALGHFALAIADFDSALKRNANDADTLVARSFAFTGSGAYDKAIADADRAIELSPVSGATEAFDSRGNAHFHKGDFAAAIDDYTAALKLWPENPQALYGRGAAKSRRGDTTGAAADMNAARALKADIAAAEEKLGIGP
ncbi:MAG: tetratricopeptide repeat protein, partial [Alphaproteobacteria bacterium]|nr:tetratricopeptide repeat protein [Alphaproteobacteria bacterium]